MPRSDPTLPPLTPELQQLLQEHAQPITPEMEQAVRDWRPQTLYPVRPCKHRHTVYDEKQGALWCRRCGGWVIR